MVNISSVSISKGIVEIELEFVDELYKQETREREQLQEALYRFDLHEVETYNYLGNKLAKMAKIPKYKRKKMTWEDVLHSILGRTYTYGFRSEYRVWE